MVDSFAEGDSVMPFASLFSMGAGSSSAPVSEAGSVAPPLSPEALEALVDRILVSSAEMGRAEVRLTLRDSVLGGTEIVLSRSIDGQLTVSLHCTSESSFQTLVASQMELKGRLEDFENRSVQVSVDIDREGSDADRRSRGYFEQEQQEA
jgi:type III secretion system needle length determinant